MRFHYKRFLSSLLLLILIFGLVNPVSAFADNGDFFSFTPEEYGSKLDDVLKGRDHTCLTAKNPSAGIITTDLFELEGEQECVGTVMYSSRDLNNQATSLNQRDITLIVSFIYDDPAKPARLEKICMSMVQAVDPDATEEEARTVVEEAKKAAKSNSAYEFHGAVYQLFDKSGDTPYGFVIGADGIVTDLSKQAIPAPGYAVTGDGFSSTVGELLTALELLITDSNSPFYAGSSCHMKASSSDPELKSVIECGNNTFILTFSRADTDKSLTAADSFQHVIAVAFLQDTNGTDALEKILTAIIYLTNDDLASYADSRDFLDRLATEVSSGKWTRSGAMEYILAGQTGMIGLSVREYAAYN